MFCTQGSKEELFLNLDLKYLITVENSLEYKLRDNMDNKG